MNDHHDPLLDVLHEDRSGYGGAFNPPIVRSSTFGQRSFEELMAPNPKPPKYVYSRLANPTVHAFEEIIAKMENGDEAVAFGSGMGAITAAILAFVRYGDHILCVNNAYGPAKMFLTEFTPRMGLTVEYFVPGTDLEPMLRENTRLIYLESPTTFQFEVLDLRAISKVARAHGVLTIIDNTWATPLYQKPLDLGIDISLHSVTKYINGHSDILGGAAVTSAALMEKLRPMAVLLGANMSAEDAYLAIRGLRTLAVRMPQHMESGLKVAHWLHAHPLVEKVSHPGLPDSPFYELGRSQMTGYSGLFAFTVKAAPAGACTIFGTSLKLFGIAPSWGGFESLIVPIATQPNQPASFRLSIGLEPVDELIADLEQALLCYGEVLNCQVND